MLSAIAISLFLILESVAGVIYGLYKQRNKMVLAYAILLLLSTSVLVTVIVKLGIKIGVNYSAKEECDE
jgi:uncharacterized membrane protein